MSTPQQYVFDVTPSAPSEDKPPSYSTTGGGYSPNFYPAVSATTYTDDKRFLDITNEYGIDEKSRAKLYTCAGSCFPVIVVDDSGSMTSRDESGKTRWANQVEYLKVLIPFLISLHGSVDIHFLNRGSLFDVKDLNTAAPYFVEPPSAESRTPLCTKFTEIYRDPRYSAMLKEKGMLLFNTTDGEPSDIPHGSDKKQAITQLFMDNRPKNPPLGNKKEQKQGNVYISTIVFTEVEEDVEYLDAIRNKDPNHIAVTESFINERKEMKEIHGNSFKYELRDHMIQTILAVVDPETYKKYEQPSPCCVIL